MCIRIQQIIKPFRSTLDSITRYRINFPFSLFLRFISAYLPIFKIKPGKMAMEFFFVNFYIASSVSEREIKNDNVFIYPFIVSKLPKALQTV